MHVRLRKIRLMRSRNRRWLSRFTRNERGVQLAELAIVLPILALLFGATAEFGRYFYEYTTLAKASRVGARYLASACVRTTEDTNAKNIVVYGNAAGTGSPILTGVTPLAPANIDIIRRDSTGAVMPPPPNAGVPQTVTVTVKDYKFTPLFNLGGLMNNNGLSLNIDVKPSVTMRYLLSTPCDL
jgi:Flp pilus assembly protein TadG